MSRKSVVILATTSLILAAAVVASGRYLRRQFVAMHGAAPQESHASKGGGGLHEAAAAAARPRPTPSLGDRAHQWVPAFGAGEDAMREFITRNFAPEALTKRDVDERMKGYAKLRDRFGTLKPEKILSSEPGEIEAILIAEDGSEHEFIFTGQEKAPFKLVSIAYRDVQHGH